MGSSIGVQENKASGSLGGFMKLKVGNQVHKGFLTNHHVISHDIPSDCVQVLNQKGYQYPSDNTPRPCIQYPSSEDLCYKH